MPFAKYSSPGHRLHTFLNVCQVAGALGASLSEAETSDLVDTEDQEREERITHYLGSQGLSRHLHHAMLNTAVVDHVAVDMILDLMDATNKRGTANPCPSAERKKHIQCAV